MTSSEALLHPVADHAGSPDPSPEQRIARLIIEQSATALQKELVRVKSLMSCYRCALLEVETKFRVLDEQFSLSHERNPIESIKTRVKSPESIREKLARKGLPATVESISEEIRDVAGVRVVCSFVDDIYFLADCLLAQDDVTLLERKDYVEHPKGNGYRSLHLIVEVPIFLHGEKRPMKVEVQLRTIAMEFWANLEHKLRYKKTLDDDTMARVSAELLACAESSAALDARMQSVRDIIEGGKAPHPSTEPDFEKERA